MVSRRRSITTIGSAVRDVIFYTNQGDMIKNRQDPTRVLLVAFEYGAKIVSDQVYFTLGGGALNTAITFAQMNIPAAIVTQIGHDANGDEIIKQIRSKGISDRLVQVSAGGQTGSSFIVSFPDRRDHVIFSYRGSELELSHRLVEKIKSPWIYLASLTGNWKTSLSHLFRAIERKRLHLAWNPGAEQISWGLVALKKYLALTEVLLLNRDEAIELAIKADIKLPSSDPRTVIGRVHGAGQRITAVTDGPRGAYVYDGRRLLFKSALKNKPVNTTGAGDAFGSGLVSGLMKFSYNLSRALALAIYNSNSVITKIGAQNGLLISHDIKKYNI